VTSGMMISSTPAFRGEDQCSGGVLAIAEVNDRISTDRRMRCHTTRAARIVILNGKKTQWPYPRLPHTDCVAAAARSFRVGVTAWTRTMLCISSALSATVSFALRLAD